MSRSLNTVRLIVAACLLLSSVTLGESALRAQGGADTNAVSIPTVDGIKLKGVFYESGKKNSATVIMLHPVGEGKSIKSQDWKNLAEALSKAGYSVMMFDFRGHGDSTTIEDPAAFAAYPANRSFKLKVKDEIDVRDYINTAYLPVLVNDIAAVKAYLDRKHDGGGCNTSNTIIVGADNGATLGAIWMNSEMHRYKLTPPTMIGKQAVVDKRAEGKDILAAVFLNITPNLSPKRTVSVGGILNVPCKVNGIGATFFYGDKDNKAKEYAKTLETSLKTKGSKKHDYIGAVGMPNTSLTGVKLLQKSLETDKTIVEYLKGIMDERANEYIERDYQNNHYIWRDNNGKPIPAKNKKGERNLLFNTYEQFTR